MPELPEVENLRRGLQEALRGRRIRRVTVKKPRLVSGRGNIRPASVQKAAEFSRRLKNERIAGVERLAKNLIFNLESGAVVVAHLKMSGQFAYRLDSSGPPRRAAVIGGHPIELSEHELPNKHTHIIFELDRGFLYYNDTRMFGYVLWYPNADAARAAHFQKTGMEPFSREFTPAKFHAGLRKSAAQLKAVLLGQSIVNGLGNIYADEVCWAARVRPDRRANTLTRLESKKLHAVIKRILKKAIAKGGSSVASYRLLDMSRGNYAREHKVYGRAGKPCVKCGRPLSKMLIQSRTTVFCKKCQR
jgi:formamidopyrimidine-DNA glycosylase